MIETDGRKLTTEQQHLLRVKAVDMVVKEGISKRQASKLLGISRQHVHKWCIAFEENGYEGLKMGRRGRRLGEKRLLAAHQCATICNIIRDKTPDQCKMDFVLWERIAVRELIENKYGILLPLRTISEYLKRWGMTAQKPVKQANQRNEQKINDWLNTEYPKIEKQASKQGATILWGDETGVENNYGQGKSFSPRGKTPVVKKDGRKFRVNMVSAITNRGHVRFCIYTGKMTQQLFIDFLKKLLKSFSEKVFLILDNLKVHHGKLVKEWVSQNVDRIELFFIPSYAPELNPDEYLNRDLKRNVNLKYKVKSVADLKRNLIRFMRSLQKLPDRVKKYFNSKEIQYAAL